ncbi:thioredoxin domain-containing protein [Tautonia plasticadhaerens]|uniref:RedB protein n=1 Tax=Tautonia plasticadhaerens TaxID=2527974 RepID=A0A518HC65_9BACT|nr:hypothetical protein [Tautonia plasticadhaerens]QDV38427.1 hypothetical protein ElP_63820 [Tautonia plasticadhaerens]
MDDRLLKPLLPLAVTGWGLLVGAGHLLLGAHANRPGDPGAPPGRWPAGSRIAPDLGRPELLIFLHPRCPCSKASVEELAAALEPSRDRISVRAVLLRYGGRRGGPESDLGRLVRDRLGVEARPDPGGEEARRFGVTTSGHVLLFGPRGELAFSGGITAGRGHRGDNAGREAIRSLLRFGDAAASSHPVFGCPLSPPPRESPR